MHVHVNVGQKWTSLTLYILDIFAATTTVTLKTNFLFDRHQKAFHGVYIYSKSIKQTQFLTILLKIITEMQIVYKLFSRTAMGQEANVNVNNLRFEWPSVLFSNAIYSVDMSLGLNTSHFLISRSNVANLMNPFSPYWCHTD